jgi:ribosomal-protein-alanine acetyltransferase
MKIRNASSNDLSGVLELGRHSPTAAQWSEHTYSGILGGNDGSRIALVAEVKGEIVGHIIARIVTDECELEDIVVSPSKRRRSIGSELIRNLISAALERGVRRLFLEVRESNSEARSFYEKRGFLEVGSRNAYYISPTENAVLYAIKLA